MPKYSVNKLITKSYLIEVEANDKDEAIDIADSIDVSSIKLNYETTYFAIDEDN
jgi:hypothetical protein